MPRSLKKKNKRERAAAVAADGVGGGLRQPRRAILALVAALLCAVGVIKNLGTVQGLRELLVLDQVQTFSFSAVMQGYGILSSSKTEPPLEETVCVSSDQVEKSPSNNIPDPTPMIQNLSQVAACRVLVENRPDWHYELIESVIVKYPLPWHELSECDFSKGNHVIFDVALAKQGTLFHELEDFQEYFRTYLQATLRQRTDGITAIVGELVPHTPYDRLFAARIGVSCGSHDSKAYIREDPIRNFCVMHTSCSSQTCDQHVEQRSCWLNPMHAHTCYFVPDVYPMFPDSICQDDDTTKLRLCVIGASKHHGFLAKALAANKEYYLNTNVQVNVLHRDDKLPDQYINNNVQDLAIYVRSKSYLDFQRAVSKCHISLPMLDPDLNAGYFPWARNSLKLSGSLSQTIGYALPVVLHEQLYAEYKPALRAPANSYNSSIESFTTALESMIEQVKASLPEQRQQACANPMVVRGKTCTPQYKSSLIQKRPLQITATSANEPSTPPTPPPEPAWISKDPILHDQEVRQLHWEQNKKQQKEEQAKAKTIRRTFQERLQQVANNPSNTALQNQAKMQMIEALATFSREGYDPTDTKQDPVFDDILVAVELPKEFMEPGDGIGQSKKALVGEHLFQQLNGTCVVYGAGIAYELSFERDFARKFGCAVHAFDCTMLDQQRLQYYINQHKDLLNFAFHPWCVGEATSAPQDMELVGNTYDLSKLSQDGSSALVRLDEIMHRLDHEEVDILKFDIEGFEWKLFDSILKDSKKKLPRQIAFELHTRHANPHYVPISLVADNGREAVVRLFDQLYRLGYRVVSKELNFGDFRCAEFVVYRFYDPDE